MNSRRIPFVVMVLALPFAVPKPSHAASPQTALQSLQTSSTLSPSAAAQSQPSSAPRITKYTLPPDRYQKARNINRIRFWGIIGTFVYGLVVLGWFCAGSWQQNIARSPRTFPPSAFCRPLCSHLW